MVKYPSSAVEQTRESISSFENPLETILLLTCLAKNGMREDRKKALIGDCAQSWKISEEELVELYMILDMDTIYGFNMNSNQKRLGYEPSGNYRHEEYLTARALEGMLNIRLYRSEDPRYDFTWHNQKWDLIGPVAPFYFNSDNFLEALYRHLDNKQGLDTLVTCTLTLSEQEQRRIRGLIEYEQSKREMDILLLDRETFKDANRTLHSFNFLCSSTLIVI